MQCASHSIPAQESVKYHGIEIDPHVSGEKIAKCVLRKANARLKFLYRQGKYLNFNCRKLLFPALIHSFFFIMLPILGFQVWILILKTSSNSNFKNKLRQRTQNKIVRFITNQGPQSHVGQYERSQIGYLSDDDRVKFLRLCHTYKIFYNISAPYLHDNFVRVTEVLRYNIRSSSFNFRVPTFFNCTIHDWNSLPKEIKRIKNLNQFKSATKTHLANCALQKE